MFKLFLCVRIEAPQDISCVWGECGYDDLIACGLGENPGDLEFGFGCGRIEARPTRKVLCKQSLFTRQHKAHVFPKQEFYGEFSLCNPSNVYHANVSLNRGIATECCRNCELSKGRLKYLGFQSNLFDVVCIDRDDVLALRP